MKILLAEDDDALAGELARALRAEGFALDRARDGIDAGHLGETETYDAVVLDLGLPGRDGVSVLQDWRAAGRTMPVLVLTARDGWSDKVTGFKAGADDYLVKPFGAGELMARMRAQLRRHLHQTPSGDSVIRFGDVEVDLIKRSVSRSGEALHLTPIEYKLLISLASQPDRVITHSQLLKTVWGPGHGEDTHYVRVHMANLRKKVEASPSMPKHLLTEAGVGYRFVQGG